jgi:hypothetical protein
MVILVKFEFFEKIIPTNELLNDISEIRSGATLDISDILLFEICEGKIL